MSAPNTISIERLVRLVGTPKCPTLIDVRPQPEFEANPHLIPSSRHRTFEELEGSNEIFGSQSALVICREGGSLSQGVAAWLRERGVVAELLGGGWQAWHKLAFR